MNANHRRVVFSSCALTNDIKSSPILSFIIFYFQYYFVLTTLGQVVGKKKTDLFSYILVGRQLHYSVIIHYTLIPIYCYIYFVVYKYTV